MKAQLESTHPEYSQHPGFDREYIPFDVRVAFGISIPVPEAIHLVDWEIRTELSKTLRTLGIILQTAHHFRML